MLPILICIIFSNSFISAQTLGITLSTFSPLTGETIIEKGSYGRAGILMPLTDSIELEAAASVQVTPKPLSRAIVTAQFSYSHHITPRTGYTHNNP